MAKAESSLRRSIIGALRREGWLVVSLPGGPFTGAGRPDIVVCANSKFGAIEIKTKKGKLSPAQELWLRAVRRAGGFSFVARSAKEAVEGVRYFLSGGKTDMDIVDIDVSGLGADGPRGSECVPPAGSGGGLDNGLAEAIALLADEIRMLRSEMTCAAKFPSPLSETLRMLVESVRMIQYFVEKAFYHGWGELGQGRANPPTEPVRQNGRDGSEEACQEPGGEDAEPTETSKRKRGRPPKR